MIEELSFLERSLLLARLANTSYRDEASARKRGQQLGFTEITFLNRDGAQAYCFSSKDDLVIACRGTEPGEWNDVRADLRAALVAAETVGRVHRGFKQECDDLWALIVPHLHTAGTRKVWFCGHSLGAAMATILASRCQHDIILPEVAELYTYGSPRVGNNRFCTSLCVTHHRWVNNNDIVTRVPLWLMGYRHDGREHYISSRGTLSASVGLERAWDRLRGIALGLVHLRFDSIADHSMPGYVTTLERIARGDA